MEEIERLLNNAHKAINHNELVSAICYILTILERLAYTINSLPKGGD